MNRAPAAFLAAALIALGATASLAGDGEGTKGRDETPAERNRRAFEAIAGYDKDGDGRLTREEFPFDSVFDLLDLDGDGFVTFEELRQVVAQEADGDSPDDEHPVPPPPPAPPPPPRKGAPADRPGKDRPKVPPPGDGAGPATPERKMDAARAREIIAVDPRWNPETRLKTVLRAFDRDPKDGKIQKKEYPGGEADSIFRKYDRSRDGELDERELLVLMKEQVADLEKERRRPGRGNFHYLFDLDQDNRVTKEEYALLRGPAAPFNEYDVDRDGVVGYDEIRYPERYTGREAAAAVAENRSVWDLYDANGDRRVSLEEFGGSESVFRRLDRNGDGWLTLADG